MGGTHGHQFKRISEILSVNCETSPNSFSSVSKMLITSHTPPNRRVKDSFLQNKPPASGVKSFRYWYFWLPNKKGQLATTSSSLKGRHVLPTHTQSSQHVFQCFTIKNEQRTRDHQTIRKSSVKKAVDGISWNTMTSSSQWNVSRVSPPGLGVKRSCAFPISRRYFVCKHKQKIKERNNQRTGGLGNWK